MTTFIIQHPLEPQIRVSISREAWNDNALTGILTINRVNHNDKNNEWQAETSVNTNWLHTQNSRTNMKTKTLHWQHIKN